MTPEAKQATAGWPDWVRLEDCQKTIDTATAKLREELAQKIYMWLGQWRDALPPHAVTALQDILGPLK